MRLPEFLLIGACRCGTTSLYEYLRCHPQVYLPEQKKPEPHFFLKENEYQKGIEYYARKYFYNIGEQKIAGEASTSYIYQPYVAERIKKHLPNVKLIAMLRNPIDRALSAYIATLRNNLETLPFSEAIRKEKERLSNPKSKFDAEILPHAYIDRGRYYQQLKIYLEFFGRDRLHVILFEDFAQDNLKELQKIFHFLDIDPSYEPPNLNKILNKSARYDDKIDIEDRTYMFNELKDDIKNLSALLQRDLSAWK